MIRKELITDLTLEAGGTLSGAHVVYHVSQEAWDGRKPVRPARIRRRGSPGSWISRR